MTILYSFPFLNKLFLALSIFMIFVIWEINYSDVCAENLLKIILYRGKVKKNSSSNFIFELFGSTICANQCNLFSTFVFCEI